MEYILKGINKQEYIIVDSDCFDLTPENEIISNGQKRDFYFSNVYIKINSNILFKEIGKREIWACDDLNIFMDLLNSKNLQEFLKNDDIEIFIDDLMTISDGVSDCIVIPSGFNKWNCVLWTHDILDNIRDKEEIEYLLKNKSKFKKVINSLGKEYFLLKDKEIWDYIIFEI